jgi:hypothetical protein
VTTLVPSFSWNLLCGTNLSLFSAADIIRSSLSLLMNIGKLELAS